MSSVQRKLGCDTDESGRGFVRDLLHVSEIQTLAELALREARERFGIDELALSGNTERIHVDGRSDSRGCHPPGLAADPAAQRIPLFNAANGMRAELAWKPATEQGKAHGREWDRFLEDLAVVAERILQR